MALGRRLIQEPLRLRLRREGLNPQSNWEASEFGFHVKPVTLAGVVNLEPDSDPLPDLNRAISGKLRIGIRNSTGLQ